MRRLLLTLLAGLLVLPAAVLTAPAAHACSCDRPDAQEALSRSDVIARVSVVREGEQDGERVYDLLVEREWKGPGHSFAQLRTAQETTACGLALREGQGYVLFASEREGGGWASSWCTATFAVGAQDPTVTQAEIEERYGAGTVPMPPSDHVESTGLPWAIIAAGALVVGVLGVVGVGLLLLLLGVGRDRPGAR